MTEHEAFEQFSKQYDYAVNSPYSVWQAACQWQRAALQQATQEPSAVWQDICERSAGVVLNGKKGLAILEDDLVRIGDMLAAPAQQDHIVDANEMPDYLLGFAHGQLHAEARRLAPVYAEQAEVQQATFEVWQDGMCVASATGSREDAMWEAQHYATMYGQDGPVEVREAQQEGDTQDAVEG